MSHSPSPAPMLDGKKLAESHPMDIPHITAVELPVHVKNVNRAINALGGKKRISESINHGEPLELRLRNDPFHHPIQALTSNNERVLLKVTMSKKTIRKDEDGKLLLRELIKMNDADPSTPKTRIQPIAIIDKTFRFRAMADFQVITKNSPMVQQFNENVRHPKNFKSVANYVAQHGDMNGYMDLNSEYFKNKDHDLPPPPILSPIRFPFDYNYKMNRATTTIMDKQSGQKKVVSTKTALKLHTKIIDHTATPPSQPAADLIKNREMIEKEQHQLPPLHPNIMLLKCIEWLETMFEIKPFWIRKHLMDLAPKEYQKYIKLALPYVTYIYRSGPWRFCNIKLGIDPRSDSKYWKYQSEYFRVLGVRNSSDSNSSSIKRITPPSLEHTLSLDFSQSENKLELAQNLFFDGTNLPTAVTYQVGDILDLDISSTIESHIKDMGKDFLRKTWDVQDGWLNATTMEVIRKIVRYKLKQLVNEEPIDQNKIYKIINSPREEAFASRTSKVGTTKSNDKNNIDNIKTDANIEGEGEEDEEEDEEEEDEEDDEELVRNEEEEEAELEGDEVHDMTLTEEMISRGEAPYGGTSGAMADRMVDGMNVGKTEEDEGDVDDVISRLNNLNGDAAQKIKHLVKIIKQDDIDYMNE